MIRASLSICENLQEEIGTIINYIENVRISEVTILVLSPTDWPEHVGKESFTRHVATHSLPRPIERVRSYKAHVAPIELQVF